MEVQGKCEMMYFLTVANFVVFALAAYVNIRKIKKDNPRSGLRFAWAYVCCGVSIMYFFGVIGVLSSEQIPFFARAIMMALGFVAIAEGANG